MAKKKTNAETTSTDTTTTTAVTTAADATQMVVNQFFNIDFAAMNGIIDSLANRGELSKIEKREANEIIDTWNANVVHKLDMEVDNIRGFLDGLTSKNSDGVAKFIRSQTFVPEIEMLVELTGAQDEYEALKELIEEYDNAMLERRTITEPVEDIDTTKGEYIVARREYEYALTAVNAKIRNIGNNILKGNIALTQKFLASDDVKRIINQLQRKANKMTKMRTECCDKAQLAKINITIDDANIRASLKSLIELTKF